MTNSQPDTLYHYTDTNSLMSILRTQTLWATDAIYLNDTREIRYGIKKFKQVLNSYTPTNDAESWAVRAASVQIDDIEKSLYDGDSRRVYVTCFSEKSDSLSQWRGYGSSGSGFAIGFDRKLLADLRYDVESVVDPLKIIHTSMRDDLESAMSSIVDPFGIDRFNSKSIVGWAKTFDVYPVEYGNKKARSACDSLVESIVEDRSITGLPKQWPQIFIATVGVERLCLIKDKSFKDEREWRVVVAEFLRKPIPEFRSNATLGVVPYIVLKLPPNAIKSIVVGPGRHANIRGESVKQLLAQLGIADVEVINSEVPFRS
ncbi:DUF2971 domain-containing protein [Rhodococcus erythropolis]|uniref:DUF2971 domain-containing protein n=1 Tax=Rhodococcus erythropolis TaxID=1833 RepID=UPI00367015FD